MQSNWNGFSFDLPPEKGGSDIAVDVHSIESRSGLLSKAELLDLTSLSSTLSNWARVQIRRDRESCASEALPRHVVFVVVIN